MRADPTPPLETTPLIKTKAPSMKSPHRPRLLTLAIWAALPALSLSSTAWAQAAQAISGQPISGQPIFGVGAPLYPASPFSANSRPTALRGESMLDYALNQAVANMVVELDRNAVPADGQSPTKVTVRLFGANGKPVPSVTFVTIESSGGRILLAGARTDEQGPLAMDADKVTPGVQLRVLNGVAEFFLLAPMTPQDVRLRVTAGDVEASGTVSFVPEMREMLAAGLIEGIVNFRGKSSHVLQPVRRGDAFEQDLQRWSREFNDGKANVGARAAFFVKGVIKGVVRGDVLLTAAYDSDKESRSRLLRDVKPEAFYPVYGDASLRGFDARSADRLYVRLDQDKSYLLYGDFQTGDGFSQSSGGGAVASIQQRSLGAYNRTATGLRAHNETDQYVGNVYATRDTLRQVVEEFTSQGSGPYGLANNGAAQGSEKVEVVVRDRNQPSRIVSTRALQSLVDYSFEPFSGRILLNTFLPAFDEQLNPVSLRVSYEVDQGGSAFWVTGGDVQVKLSDHIEVGGAVVNEANPLAKYRLASANAGIRVGDNTRVVVEVAQSRAEVNTNPTNQNTQGAMAGQSGDVTGRAGRIEAAYQNDRLEARAFVGRSGTTFVNPAAPLAGGRAEAQAKASYRATELVRVYGEWLKSEDRNTGGGERSAGQLGANIKLSESLTLDVGLRAIRESGGSLGPTASGAFGSTSGLTGSIATGSGGGAVGFGNQLIDPASGLPIINAGSSVPTTGAAGSSSPATDSRSDTVRVGLGWRANDQLTLGAELEASFNGDRRRRLALGGDYQVAERTKLYGRFESQTGVAGPYAITNTERRGNALVFGVDSTYLRDTQAFSEYRLRDAIGGRDLQLASGVRNVWDVKEGIRISSAAEHTKVLSGNVADASALALGVDYSVHPLWRISTRGEFRRSGDVANTVGNDAFNTLLWQVTVARKLDRDWTALARNYLLKTDYTAKGDVLQDRFQIGLAYRDTDTNRVNALAKVEFKNEVDASNATAGELRSRATIVSTHADYHPSRPWWMTGRVAGKWQTDQFEGGVKSNFKAALLAGRLVYDITEHWDLGVLGAVQAGQGGAQQKAVGIEAGYLIRQNLWASVGFNASGFRGDADLAGYEYTQRGAYIRLRFKFDEDLFKGKNVDINRSLDR